MLTMAKAGRKPKHKSITGRPSEQVGVRLPGDIMTAIEQFADNQRIRPNITDIVELALTEFLVREGYWPLKIPDEKKEK
jgi:hypothetical protein